ncbi:hypothetical protein [Pandoraea sp. CB10b_02]|uniref:c-type cytochrome n=1 Tax=Pandoraea sp. CB10b_02 TaxID=2014535 RepID=UPI002580B841|nr:hypothetical protein [Pandoraea sp. CB10b_02]
MRAIPPMPNRRYRARQGWATPAALVLGAAMLVASAGHAAFAEGAPAAAPSPAPSPAQPVAQPSTARAPSPDWQARDWALACMSCHHASAPVSAGNATLPTLPTLEGRPAAELVAALQAMRDGRQPATLMPQLLRGYRDDELRRIAEYFAAQPRLPGRPARPGPRAASRTSR